MNSIMQTGSNTPANTVVSTKVPLEYLLDYASGATPEPVALAIATLLTMNPVDAAVYRQLNAVGGALLEALPVNLATSEDMQLTSMMVQLDEVPQDAITAPQLQAPSTVPTPLQLYVGESFESVRWHQVTQGVEEFVLNTGTRGYRTALLRIAPGKAMPLHRHGGLEMTVVLEGAYDDVNGRFARGDLEIAGVHDEHQPVADRLTGCLCLAVLSAPLRLSGFIGWFVNPFLRV
jgi:putative transcriptional regulator